MIALDESHVFRLFILELLAKYFKAFKLVCLQAKAFVNVVPGVAVWTWVREIEGGVGNDLVRGLNQVGGLLFEQVIASLFELFAVIGRHLKTLVRRSQFSIAARREALNHSLVGVHKAEVFQGYVEKSRLFLILFMDLFPALLQVTARQSIH